MSKKNHDQQEEQTTSEEQVEETTTEGAVPLTDEEKKARKAAANKRWAERRKEATPRVVQFLKDNKEQLGAVYDDLALFFAAELRTPAGPKATKSPVAPSINAELKAALEQGPLSELDVFRKFHIGRPEMKLKIRAFILTPKVEDRVWVAFDEASESYSIVGRGEAAPEGWTGYLPQAKAEL